MNIEREGGGDKGRERVKRGRERDMNMERERWGVKNKYIDGERWREREME